MDPTLIQNPDWSGVALYVVLLVGVVAGTVFFNRSSNGDWVDERHGKGSIDDPWGLPR